MMTDFEYALVRRPGRKTASISVSPENAITVKVPSGMKTDAIEAFVARHSNWVRKKIRFNTEVREPYTPRQFVNGEELFYLGNPLRLSIEQPGPAGVALENGTLRVRVPADAENGGGRQKKLIALLIERWYRVRAESDLRKRIGSFAPSVGTEPKEFRIRAYKSRWGSCTSTGHLAFDWKIMMAPEAVVDYVVVHELCHLVHHDHSPKFWKLVESILPGYKAQKEWLKIKGNRLAL
jgi:predicted metal-dependent hydrolase